MENLLASTDQLKGKQRENLENFADQALLSKQLATIILDVPIDSDWEDLTIGGRNDEALKSLLAELEFNSVGKRIFGKDFAALRILSRFTMFYVCPFTMTSHAILLHHRTGTTCGHCP